MPIRPLYAAALAAVLLVSPFVPSLASSAAAAETCPQHYVEGQAPRILNDKLARATRPLCYKVFGIMHSGVTRTPLWSAEHLTPRRIAAAEDMSRDNAFHAEKRLPKAQRLQSRVTRPRRHPRPPSSSRAPRRMDPRRRRLPRPR